MKVKMKLKQKHPAKKMRFLRHTITMKLQEFDLNKKEIESLKGPGPQHWFLVKEVKKETREK